MKELEQLLVLVLAAVVLAAAARRVGAPYPVFLALGGAVLAFVPGTPSFMVPPELALALFVAPVRLDAAYDAVLAMRTTDEIGDDACHLMEEELDWLEMADRRDHVS